MQQAAFTAKDDTGILVNSDFLNGKTVKDAIPAMIQWLEEKGIGAAKVNYKLRDWVFSRQRYWGEPIPMVYCEKCGWQPLPEEQLPLLLPEAVSYTHLSCSFSRWRARPSRDFTVPWATPSTRAISATGKSS